MDKNTGFPAYLQLCLDFANTMDWHASEHPVETLHRYADLVAWAERNQLLTNGEAEQLKALAARAVPEAQQVLEAALVLREALYRILAAIAAEGTPAPSDLAVLNAALPDAYQHLRIIQTPEGFAWGWIDTGAVLDCLVWPIVRSAADLLTFNNLSRVRQCADDRGCGFLFIDTTRNRSRRWCSMEGCGNRAKARRHYERSVAPDKATDSPSH
ncbi:MAG: ABATE domain-containing protein [Caldilineaceae bacterium]